MIPSETTRLADWLSVVKPVAVSRVGETKVVANGEPPRETRAAGVKPEPCTVILYTPSGMVNGATLDTTVDPWFCELMVVVSCCAFSVAVMTAFELNPPFEDAEKLALTWPADTATLDATVTAELLLFRLTVVVARVEWLRVTVHVVEECEPIVEGLQFSVLSCTPATGI